MVGSLCWISDEKEGWLPCTYLGDQMVQLVGSSRKISAVKHSIQPMGFINITEAVSSG